MDEEILIKARINRGIVYNPLLCKKLNTVNIDIFDKALSSQSAFILKFNDNYSFAVSRWVSPKRTRSYPYARVYDTLNYSDRKVTIIPIIKDEGRGGDRDFLQWDTISLMSLLDIYVIIGYYSDAMKNPRYNDKITKQQFNIQYIKDKLEELTTFRSSALHWNMHQVENIWEVAEKALDAYERISNEQGVEMTSFERARARIAAIKQSKDYFMNHSRLLAELAQRRETVTIQPRENLSGIKGMITIQNYLGGSYYFTSDEVEVDGDNIFLIDAKHTNTDSLPSINDIKDGLIKMALFTNLENVTINERLLNSTSVLKLTTGLMFNVNNMNSTNDEILKLLKQEAQRNNFRLLLNNSYIE